MVSYDKNQGADEFIHLNPGGAESALLILNVI